MKIWQLIWILPGFVSILSCTSGGSDDHTVPDVILAEVFDQKLTLSEIKPLLVETTSAEDSVSQVRTHVESWVRESLLMHEAERHVPVDVNIDQLVEDYRASLLISNYENILVRTLLDTVITESELRAYYERNKRQYQLDAPILRAYFVRLPKPVKEREMFVRLWNSKRPDDLAALVMYCQTHATDYLLQDSTWYRQPDLERYLPSGALNRQNLYPGRVMSMNDQAFEYHIRIFERYGAQEIAPLSYVSEQARRYILHKRKIELLEKIKADIYAREIDGMNVKIHI